MATLSWGKPTVETVKLINGEIPTEAVWIKFPEIKTGTAKLTTTKGNKVEAIAEGGEIVDVRYEKNKYLFECEIFVQKGLTKPIQDDDGIISDAYAIRLTPEDETTEGFIIKNTSVACEENWTAADGKIWKYTFDGLKPKSGKIVEPYIKSAN